MNRTMRRTTLSALTLLLAAGPAVAQPVEKAPDASPWLAVVAAIFLVLLVCIGSFMSSRRGHQD